jgi:hypothetical protein
MLRLRTVSPKTSPKTSVTSLPGKSFMVEISIWNLPLSVDGANLANGQTA